MDNKKSVTVSRIMIISSMLIFGSVGIFRRLIPLASATLACYRGIAGALFLLIFTTLTKRKIRNKIGFKKFAYLVITGAAIGLNWMLLFEAYNYTTVATATLCYYMQPIIVILLSPVIFKEKLTSRKIIAVIAAMLGMIFVSGIAGGAAESASSVKGVLFGLGAAVLYSTVVIMNKKLPGIDAYEKTTVQLASAAIILLPYVIITGGVGGVVLDTTSIIMLVIIGLVHTGVAYALYFGSMDALPVQTVAIVSYLDPIAAMILSVIVLHEKITVFEILGAVLILGATAFIGEE